MSHETISTAPGDGRAEQAQLLLAHADELFDRPVVVRRDIDPSSPVEHYEIEDILNRKETAEDGTVTRTPVVRLRNPGDTDYMGHFYVPAEEFLRWQENAGAEPLISASSSKEVPDEALAALEGVPSDAKEQDAETFSPREARLIELKDEYKLDDGAGAEELAKCIEDRLVSLRPLTSLLSGMSDLRATVRAIQETVGGRGLIQVSIRQQQEIQDFIDRGGVGMLRELAEDPALRHAKRASRLDREYNGLFISPTQVASLERLATVGACLREIQPLQADLPRVLHKIEQDLADVVGYRDAVAVATAESNEATYEGEFRNQQIEEWVDAVKSAESPEEIESAIAAMRSAIGVESRMVDDPNSPCAWFSDRVKEDSDKAREGLHFSRRQSGITGAHQYVAELMADMVGGKFVAGDFIDAIDVDVKKRMVKLGQHRAAALAMLHGDSWMEHAADYGQPVNTV